MSGAGDGRGVIVLGAGGHARVVVEALLRSEATILGLVDRDRSSLSILGVPILGDDDAVLRHPPEEVRLTVGVGSVGDPSARRALYEQFRAKGYDFLTLVHPSAVVAGDVALGPGAQIMAGVVLQPGVEIGCNAIVNTRASVDHDCRIGDHVHIAPGATLSGGVTVGEGAHIGPGAVIVHSSHLGAGAFVGAGAVVTGDVDAGIRIRAPKSTAAPAPAS